MSKFRKIYIYNSCLALVFFPSCVAFHLENPDSEVVMYVLLRAVDRFYNQYNRYPGSYDDQVEGDTYKLKVCKITASYCTHATSYIWFDLFTLLYWKSHIYIDNNNNNNNTNAIIGRPFFACNIIHLICLHCYIDNHIFILIIIIIIQKICSAHISTLLGAQSTNPETPRQAPSLSR